MASPDRPHRIDLALPPLDDDARVRAGDEDWDVDLLDPEDPDERSILIRLAHPDLYDAVESGLEEVLVGGEPMNPRLHVAIHEVVATQIIDDDPPEAFATLQRLVGSGLDRHEALHMLGSAVAAQLWAATHEGRPFDREEHARALDALPGSWEQPPRDGKLRPRPAASRRRP